jgi:hypothetical protein
MSLKKLQISNHVSTQQVDVTVMLQTLSQEVLDSNLGQDVGCYDVLL